MADDVTGKLINCPGGLDIATTGELHAELTDALRSHRALTLNAEHVETADAAGLQLLCALFIDAAAKHVTLKWQNPSETLRQNARMIGAAQILGLDQQG